MNPSELPSSGPAGAAPGPAAPAPDAIVATVPVPPPRPAPAAPPEQAPSGRFWIAAAVVLLAIAGLAALGESRIEALRTELALQRQQAASDAARIEQRMATLEQQWASAQSDADTAGGLDALVRERREALAAVDIERLIELAQMQLRSGAPNSVAIEALTAADARLARLSGAAPRRVQAAIHRDLARLRAAADVDVPSQAARVDALLSQVGAWPLLADASRPALRTTPLPPAATPAARREDATGARVRAWFEREFGDLLRIRRVDTPEALVLDPAQQQLARERARISLLAIRQGLLARNGAMVQAEALSLQSLLRQYFDRGNSEVDAAIGQARALAAEAASAAAPSLDESLRAVHELHPARAEPQ